MLVQDSEYRHQNVEWLHAKSSWDLVHRLNDTARIPKPSVQEYMRTVSTIHEAHFGEGLETRTAVGFVEDLVSRGLVVRSGDWWSILF